MLRGGGYQILQLSSICLLEASASQTGPESRLSTHGICCFLEDDRHSARGTEGSGRRKGPGSRPLIDNSKRDKRKEGSVQHHGGCKISDIGSKVDDRRMLGDRSRSARERDVFPIEI